MNYQNIGPMPKGTTISTDEDGKVSVDGMPAIAMTVEHRSIDDTIQIRLSASGVGDGAAHAPTLECHFILTQAAAVPVEETSMERQDEIGANYANSMIRVMAEFIGDNLTTLFAEACGQAVEAGKASESRVKVVADSIAMLLLLTNDGDPAKAKDAADLRLAEFSEVSGTDIPADMMDGMLALVKQRIDHIAASRS